MAPTAIISGPTSQQATDLGRIDSQTAVEVTIKATASPYQQPAAKNLTESRDD